MEVFYLKMNQPRLYAYRYLRQWYDIIKEIPNSKVYLLVDDPDMQKHIRNNFNFKGVPTVELESNRTSEELAEIVQVFSPRWRAAGYAHLTTFLHAREHGYKDFWNIDADDIGLYAEPRRIAELLCYVKDYAKNNGIHCFSLDAQHTIYKGVFWTFGVTYTQNNLDWLKIMREHCNDSAFLEKYFILTESTKESYVHRSIDWLMTYLREIKIANIETYYVENLRAVINHDEDAYRFPTRGLRYWQKGKCWFAVLCDAFGLGERGAIPIPQDTIRLDILLSPEEGSKRLTEVAAICVPWLSKIFDYSPQQECTTEKMYDTSAQKESLPFILPV